MIAPSGRKLFLQNRLNGDVVGKVDGQKLIGIGKVHWIDLQMDKDFHKR